MFTDVAVSLKTVANSVLVVWLINLLGPTSQLVSAQGTAANSTTDQFIRWVETHPEYVAMIGMGIVILLLFITTVVVICTVGTNRSGK